MNKLEVRKLILVSPETFQTFLNSVVVPQDVTEIERDILKIIGDSKISASRRLYHLHRIISQNLMSMKKLASDNSTIVDNLSANPSASRSLFERDPTFIPKETPTFEERGVQTKFILKRNKGTDMSTETTAATNIAHSSPNTASNTAQSISLPDSSPITSKDADTFSLNVSSIQDSGLNKSNKIQKNKGGKRIGTTKEQIFSSSIQPTKNTIPKLADIPETSVYSESNPGPNFSAEAREFVKNIEDEAGIENIDVRNLLIKNLDNSALSWADVASRDGAWSSSVSKPSAHRTKPREKQISEQRGVSSSYKPFSEAWEGYKITRKRQERGETGKRRRKN